MTKQNIDPKYPWCVNCANSSHNIHCAWAVTGKCVEGNKYIKKDESTKCAQIQVPEGYAREGDYGFMYFGGVRYLVRIKFIFELAD